MVFLSNRSRYGLVLNPRHEAGGLPMADEVDEAAYRNTVNGYLFERNDPCAVTMKTGWTGIGESGGGCLFSCWC